MFRIRKMKRNSLIVGVGLLMAAMLLASCDAGIVGNGDVQTQTKTIKDFDRLEIDGNFNVFLDQTGKAGLRIEADENIMDVIKVYESGNKLEIRSEVNILRAKKKDLYINIDDLKKLELFGAIEIRSEGKLSFQTLDIDGSGAIDMNMDVEADMLKIDISGAADFDLKGKVENAELVLSGAGGFDLIDLEVEKMNVEISGATHAKVYVTDDLKVEISGVGVVKYKGHPDITKNVSGIGSLKKY
jgi:hypothetical protein